MTVKELSGLAVFWIVLALLVSAHGAEDAGGDLYLLHIPGLGEDTMDIPNRKRHLVRLRSDRSKGTLRRVYPDLYFQEWTGFGDFWTRTLARGLAVTRNQRDGEAMTITGFIVDAPGLFSVTLEGRKERPHCWEGQATVTLFPYGHPMRGHLTSRWSLEPAPASYVYRRMVAALDHLKNLSEGPEVYYGGPPLKTKDDYVAYLRGGNWPLPEGSVFWKPIEPQFREAIADALAQGRILLEREGFAVAEGVRRTFAEEEPLRIVDTKVTAHGIPRPERQESTEEEGRLERQIRDYRPPVTAYEVRQIAGYSDPEAYLGERAEQYVAGSDYTWEELAVIPAVAFLAEHIASVPEELRDRVAQRYIRDGSEDFFPGMSWRDIARVPNPVLLLVCLPRMEQTASKQAEELRAILQKEGYTLEELEADEVSGTARIRMGRTYSRWADLSRRRIRLGQAQKLAGTPRVAKLLAASGLTTQEIGEYPIPEVVTRILSGLPAEKAQALLDDTPKFKSYLRRTDNPLLREVVQAKQLDLKPDRAE